MNRPVLFFFFLLMNVTLLNAQSNQVPLYVGTYTSADGSKGIYEFSFDTQTGDASLVRETSTANPSFIARTDKFLLATNEMTDGSQSLSSFSLGKDGLTFINKLGSGGSAPCHVVIGKDGTFAVVSNYLGGALDLFQLSPNGEILSKDDTKIYNGSSVNKARQESSHIHSAFFGPDNLLYVSDLGGDKIYILDIQKTDGGKFQFAEKGKINVNLGGGPRHIAFHPNGKLMYSLMEMTGDIESFKKKNGVWESYKIISMRSPEFEGKSGAADLKVSSDGRFLYSTDRIDANTITTFAISKSGKLRRMEVNSVLGKGPRNFNFSPDERFVLVGNQLTDEIVVFNRNQKTGKLTDSGKRIKASKPVCIIF
ncbi:lactonase family protein [Sphingobacterium cellulitidis]|uniref:lactonase family protein n=1 Tax=Sphingobacterium cellulitidis TaxID=1768011 RepID=UPI003C7D6B9A